MQIFEVIILDHTLLHQPYLLHCEYMNHQPLLLSFEDGLIFCKMEELMEELKHIYDK